MKEREGNVLVSLWWFLCSGPGFGLLWPDVSVVYLLGQVMYAMLKLQSSSLYFFWRAKVLFFK